LTIIPKISIFVFLLELYGTFSPSISTERWLSFYSASDLNRSITLKEEISSTDPFYIYTLKTLLLRRAFLSLIIGAVIALSQTRIKRLLAYSTINHVGFLLLALRITIGSIKGGTEGSRYRFLFYLIQYTLTNLNAFLILLAFGYLIQTSLVNQGTSLTDRSDIHYIKQLQGTKNHAVLRACFAFCLFSMRGIPPLLGFFGKYAVLSSLIQNGYIFLAITGILTSVISAAYYLFILNVIYFSPGFNDQENLTPDPDQNTIKPRLESLQNKSIIIPVTRLHRMMISILTLIIILF
jgi:NADH-ubiquinone oxidoreductase chain 2